jgi:methyl-accepting chemotaxis protein
LPLFRLKQAIIAYDEGDERLSIPIANNDEIAQITKAFNKKLSEIASMR